MKVEIRLPIGKGIAGHVAKTGKSIISSTPINTRDLTPKLIKRPVIARKQRYVFL
jgi:hypothetical protein